MYKTEFVEKVSANCGLSKSEIEKVMKVEREVLVSAMQTGDTIYFIGFGKFETRNIKEHKQKSFDKQPIVIPAHKRVVFTLSKKIKLTPVTPVTPVKRGRGRPRKNAPVMPVTPVTTVKRGRGRPRKNTI